MRNIYLLLIASLITTQVAAQFYVSVTGGYGVAPPGTKLGEKIDLKRINNVDVVKTPVENISGSYGSGSNFQIRTGYLFNKKLGVELAFGAVRGEEQTPTLVEGKVDKVSAKAVSNTYNLGLSLVYNITENLYTRLGPLMKVGGKTVADVVARKDLTGTPTTTTVDVLGTPTEVDIVLEEGSYADITFTQENYGRPPFGFLGAVGYKYPIGKNLEVFGEVEYMSIKVKKDKSKLTAFNLDAYGIGTYLGVTREKVIKGQYTLDKLPPGVAIETVYVDSLTPEEAKEARDNNFAAKQLTSAAPYSSLGFNIGVTYRF